MSDKKLEEWLLDNPWKPSTLLKDGVTVTGNTEPLIATGAIASLKNTIKYKVSTELVDWKKYSIQSLQFDYQCGGTFWNKNYPYTDIYEPSPYSANLDEPSVLNGGDIASAFAQHHWSTVNIALNNISITKLLVGYAAFIKKDLTEQITKDIKKQQRDACIPRHKKNARKFRPA